MRIYSLLIFIGFTLFLNFDVYLFVSGLIGRHGFYTYPLDDSYIHLAISKNIAFHGVWGVTEHQFSNSTSSPFFTLLLAGLMRLFGNDAMLPIYTNLVLANLLCVAIYLVFRCRPLLLSYLYAGLYAMVLLKIQIVSGMEHMLHIGAVCLAWISLYEWFRSGFKRKFPLYVFYFLSTLLCMTRYESMFLILPVVVVLLLTERYMEALLTALLSFTPIVFFGLYFMLQGSHFFPNSLLIKGSHTLDILPLLKRFWSNYQSSRYFLYFFIVLSLVSWPLVTSWKRTRLVPLRVVGGQTSLIFTAMSMALYLGHMTFASTGWIYRYEAYLIALFLLTTVFAWDAGFHALRAKWLKPVYLLVPVIAAYPFVNRYLGAENLMRHANKNIHDQHVQMSRFLSAYFDSSRVVANDIGALCYYTDIRLTDLAGLGSNDVFSSIMKKQGTQSYIDAKQYDLVMIFDKFYKHLDFRENIRVAELAISENRVCADSVVTFYVPANSERMEYVYDALRDFKVSLPKDVNLTIFNARDSSGASIGEARF